MRDEYTRTVAPARALAAETLKLERTLRAMHAKYHPARLPATCDDESNPVT